MAKRLMPQRSLILDAFSPAHIKDVIIGMVTRYETPKIVTINSYPIALTCRFVQLVILIYACVYILWYKRGYQDHDPSIISSVILKVKGIGTFGENNKMILDNADYIIPPQENNAVFIMTNFISTDQQQTVCGEGIDVKDAICTNDSQCIIELRRPSKRNGHWTGKCRLPEGRCEIEGWCPVENDLVLPRPIMDALNYTIKLKNFVEFTRFRVARTNILNDSRYFQTCLFHQVSDKLCPIFRLGDLLNIVETDDGERYKMLQYGAVVRIKVDWMCNLDLGQEQCKPEYSFGRLDSRSRDEHFSFGFNFRYASHWKSKTKSHRVLMKAFGLRLIVTVNGDAGRFDLLVLTLNIGSMIGVIGLATFICDIVALYFSEQGYIYRSQKFQSVHSDEPPPNSTTTLQQHSTYKQKMKKRKFQDKQMDNSQTDSIN